MLRYSREQLPPPRTDSRRGHPRACRPVLGVTMSSLVPFWFIVITILWTGFFVLEGFDFGVGMLHGFVAADDAGRRAAINTIGPLWDGNEVWLIVGRGRHVRRVPRLVRHDVLRHVPGHRPAAGFADRPRGGLRVPGQTRRGELAAHLGRAAHRGERARSAADRHRPGRPAARAADQLGPELHRVVLGPVPALRAVDRRDPGAGLPAARRDVPVPEDHRRHAPAVPAAGPLGGAGHRRLRRSGSSSGRT